jgi:hypothetical protein
MKSVAGSNKILSLQIQVLLHQVLIVQMLGISIYFHGHALIYTLLIHILSSTNLENFETALIVPNFSSDW